MTSTTFAHGTALLPGHDRLTVWEDLPRPHDVARLRATVVDGTPAVLLIGPEALPAAGRLLDLPQDLGRGEVIGRPRVDDPLILQTRLRAVAVDGSTLAGGAWTDLSPLLDAAGVTALDAGPRVLARVDDRPVALAAGSLVLVGCPDLASDRWLPTADTAAFLAWALAGLPERLSERLSERADDDAAAAARAVKLAPAGDPAAAHPEVPVVEAVGPDGATELAPWLAAAAGAGAAVATDVEATTLDSEAFLAGIRHAGRLLPAAVHDALVDLADRAPDAGAILLRGLPVGAVPPTPLRPGAATKDRISEFVLLSVARRLGHPIGYAPEHGGRIVQDLSPTPDAVTRQTSTSSGVELAFHTETAFHPHRPRYLLLLCLRGDPEARTTLCSVRAAVRRLTLGQVAVLREARFRTGVDESFVGGRSSALGHPVAVLGGTDDAPTLTFDADLMVGDDAEAQAALDALAEAVAVTRIGVTLSTGDLLVVDNLVAVHGRSPFTARFDGTDRWLQRAFVVPDLAPSAEDRTGRIVTTRFAR